LPSYTKQPEILKGFYAAPSIENLKHEGLIIETSEQKIARLNNELDALKVERDKFNEEAQAWAEKRDKIHDEIRRIGLEAKGFRDKRDELNDEIKFLKTMKEERVKKRAETFDQLKSQRLKIKDASATKTVRSSKLLEREIAKIDWQIQTKPHSLEEEKKLVNQVKTLEIQLQVNRRIEQIKNEIANLKKEARTLKDEIQTDTSKIRELAEHSQKFHEKMIRELEKAKALKTEADKMHHKFVESKEKANTCHSKYVEILDQVKALRTAIRQREEEARTKQQTDLKRKIEDEALDKLKRGKKLSFEEFKILAEQGKI